MLAWTPVSFKYDPFGRRIYKSSSSATSIFAYDGDNLVEETNSSGTAVARYSQGLNIDEPLAMLRGGATSFYHADGLGSVTSLSSAAGSIANTYTYDSFGNLTASTGSVTNPFRYTARESDTETGLYYYRARYYDPSVGRFLSEDPIGFAGGDLSFYTYVSNSVAGLFDQFGLRPGDKYPTVKCAGWHAITDYNPTSIAQNKEYGGFIYENPDGTFSYTNPHVNKDAGIGNSNGLPRFWQIPIPPNTVRGGWYHTHAAFDPRLNTGNPPPGTPGYNPDKDLNNDFSPADRDISDRDLNGLPGILGTPQNQVRLYIPNPKNPGNGIPLTLKRNPCGCE